MPTTSSALALSLTTVSIVFAGCSAEARVQKEIDEANYCSTADDCVLVGSKCPFDCYIYANKTEADRIKGLVDGFESTCQYSCLQSFGVTCTEEKKCAPIVTPPAEGNPGAACTQDSDCITPMNYMIRSVCPFTSKCIEGSCSVTCPMMDIDTSEDPSMQPVGCKADSDCSCKGFAAGDKSTCQCITGECHAVMK
jgi:hypothetical protein